MTVKAVLFDLEGTLAYYAKKHNPIDATRLVRSLGYEVRYQEWEAARRFVLFVDVPKGAINNWENFIKRMFERLEMNVGRDAMKKVASYYKKSTRFRFFDDVSAAKRIPLKKAVVTSIPRFWFTNLDMGGFDEVITSKESGAAKPNPKCFLKALHALGVNPGEALMIGNDLDADMSPAKELGIDAILIDREGILKAYGGRRISSLTEIANEISTL